MPVVFHNVELVLALHISIRSAQVGSQGDILVDGEVRSPSVQQLDLDYFPEYRCVLLSLQTVDPCRFHLH